MEQATSATDDYPKWKNCPFKSSFLYLLEGLSGVYLIWEKEQKIVLYVDKGEDLSECIDKHFTDKNDRLYYASREKSRVIYAEVREEDQSEVRSLLIQEYEPLFNRKPGLFFREINISLPTLE